MTVPYIFFTTPTSSNPVPASQIDDNFEAILDGTGGPFTGPFVLNAGDGTHDAGTITSAATSSSGATRYGLAINAANQGGGFNIQQTLSGSRAVAGGTLPLVANYIKISSDTLASTSAPSDAAVTGFGVDYYYGGSSVRGGRVSGIFNLFHTAQTSASNTNRNYTALGGYVNALAGDGGTGVTSITAKGAFFAAGFQVKTDLGADNILNATACEFDVLTLGTSYYRSGIQIVDIGSTHQGAAFDAAVSIGGSGSPVGFGTGLMFSDAHGDKPMNANARLIWAVGAHTVKAAMVVTDYTFSESVIQLPNTSTIGWMNAAGNAVVGAIQLNASNQIALGAPLSVAGAILSTLASGNVFLAAGATTGNLYAQVSNTGGNGVFGVESSAGGTLATGSSAYATVISAQTATPLQLASNNVVRLTISSTGAATFSGAVTTPASTTGTAGINLPHGSAPSSPVNGDMWTTTSGLFVRINGVTVGPLS